MLVERLIVAAVVLLIVWWGWAAFTEATFDWSRCEAQEETRDRHAPAWIQTLPSVCSGNPPTCSGGSTIFHPERNWQEQRYQCYDDGVEPFSKWREITKAGRTIAQPIQPNKD